MFIFTDSVSELNGHRLNFDKQCIIDERGGEKENAQQKRRTHEETAERGTAKSTHIQSRLNSVTCCCAFFHPTLSKESRETDRQTDREKNCTLLSTIIALWMVEAVLRALRDCRALWVTSPATAFS
jgi:hypothetical protein